MRRLHEYDKQQQQRKAPRAAGSSGARRRSPSRSRAPRRTRAARSCRDRRGRPRRDRTSRTAPATPTAAAPAPGSARFRRTRPSWPGRSSRWKLTRAGREGYGTPAFSWQNNAMPATEPARVPAFLYGTAWKEERTPALTELALRTGFRGNDTANQRRHYF